jgi:hypothetical protein
VLTASQVRRGNVTCGRACATARRHRLLSVAERESMLAALQVGRRQRIVRQFLQAILEDLRPHVTAEGFVSLKMAAHIAVKWRRLGYKNGYAVRYQHERRGVC